MTIVHEVLASIERIAPARFAFSFDKVGLQVGDPSAEVHKAVVSLDSSMAAVDYAIEQGAQLLVSHHPLIWDPLKALTPDSREGRIALKLAQHGVAFVACHTNWDCAPGGINDALASVLGLQEVRPFGSANAVEMAKLVVFAPQDTVPALLDAMSKAGAGEIGDYSSCSWRTDGTGTFVGGEGSNPAVGQAGRLEEVAEERLEMVVRMGRLPFVLAAMRKVHRYEEPAFDVIPLQPRFEQPAGRIGVLSEGIMTLAEFVAFVDDRLGTKSLAWCGPEAFSVPLITQRRSLVGRQWEAPERPVSSVAVIGGAADGEWKAAQKAGADTVVTGEVKQNVALEAAEAGVAILAAGHYATEQPGMAAFAERMRTEQPNIEWLVFEPPKGFSGRPL